MTNTIQQSGHRPEINNVGHRPTTWRNALTSVAWGIALCLLTAFDYVTENVGALLSFNYYF